MTYELIAFSTEVGYDIRYRAYTRSLKTADAFRGIPRINFTDSGHGIVFHAREMMPGAKRKPCIRILADYVRKHGVFA